MNNIKIAALDYYLPENIVDNNELSQLVPDWDPAKIVDKVGIEKRHIASKDQTALDLAELVGNKILSNYDRKKIDFLILCTQSPDYFLPTSACILQDRLGLNTNTGAFDFNLGCSGFIYGLAMAKGLIKANIAKSILLIMAETYSKYIDNNDIGNRTIFGDAASAVILEAHSDDDEILNFSLGTDGTGYQNLIVYNGGQRCKTTNGIKIANQNFYMNGPEIFNFTIKAVPTVFNDVLNVNNVSSENINYFLFHQANKYMNNYLRKKLNIPEEKFYFDILDIGNTVSSTIPIAFKRCIEKEIIHYNDFVMLLGFGVGYSWGGVIIKNKL